MASLIDFLMRLTTDEDLRESLRSNPEETLRREGADIPEGVKVEIVESTPEKIYLAMPPKVEQAEGGLTDEQLAGLPGGAGMIGTAACWGGVTTWPYACE